MFKGFHPAIKALALLTCLTPLQAFASDPFTLHSVVDDTEQYFTAPLRWDREDWAWFGVAVASVAVAHEYDDRVRSHFATGSRATQGGGSQNSLRDAAPSLAIVGGTFAYAAFLRDRDGYGETWSLLEAGVFSTATGELLKLATGRQRPDVTTSPDHWRSGGDSFPSVHASAAFAIGMVFAESGNDEYRWVRRVIGYGVAAGTSYIRVRDNSHWMSDTVAGAALGIATARFVLNRQSGETHGMLQFGPGKDGWMLSYVHDLK